MRPAFTAALAAFLSCSSASAAVTGVDIDVHEDVLDGRSWGLAGPYEKFIGTMHFAVDPANPANEIIVDIEHAPTNAEGLVEFSATFTLIKPKDIERGNGTMLLGVANRGTRRMLTFFNHAHSDDPGEWDAINPTLPEEYGDGFLMQQGFTLLWVGWQFDVPESRVGGSRAFLPRVEPDEPITGMVRSDFVVRERTFDRTLADRNHIPYPVSNPDAPGTVLTVRNSILGERRVIPRDQWAFARVENERVIPDRTRVYLETGFEPFLIYEVIYEGENPEVIGLGLAGMRDAVSMFKYGAMEDLNLPAGDDRRVVGYGMSQPGRTLRTFVYMGFNEDEQSRKAFDGIIAQIGGAARGSFNLRFGQASRDAHHYLNFVYPTDIFPFADIEMTDPVTGQTDSMLERVPEEFRPKVYNVNSSYEYWGRAVSLLTTNLDGTADIPMMDRDARVYHLAGAEHLPAEFPPSVENGQNPNNPNDFSWLMRALLVRMHDWVQDGTPPPPSVYPRIDDRTLVSVEAFNFPELPGIAVPELTHTAYRVDYGPRFESEGIITNEPPEFVGPPYTILVPQVNQDGNELGGLHTPGGLVPLATYTGWNLYNADYGPTHLNSHMSGSFLPFPKDRAARAASGDPRLSIEERYTSKAHYLGLVAGEAMALIDNGYIMAQDLPAILEQAGSIWDYVTH
ncbi:MAG TPA: alpha/beta hydrolase domain-containing protein [Gammaproteobacteria bacterium]